MLLVWSSERDLNIHSCSWIGKWKNKQFCELIWQWPNIWHEWRTTDFWTSYCFRVTVQLNSYRTGLHRAVSPPYTIFIFKCSAYFFEKGSAKGEVFLTVSHWYFYLTSTHRSNRVSRQSYNWSDINWNPVSFLYGDSGEMIFRFFRVIQWETLRNCKESFGLFCIANMYKALRRPCVIWQFKQKFIFNSNT